MGSPMARESYAPGSLVVLAVYNGLERGSVLDEGRADSAQEEEQGNLYHSSVSLCRKEAINAPNQGHR